MVLFSISSHNSSEQGTINLLRLITFTLGPYNSYSIRTFRQFLIFGLIITSILILRPYRNAAAQTVDIPDPALRSALELALGKQVGDAITQEDMASLAYLQASKCRFLTLSDMGFWWRPNRWICETNDDMSENRIQDLTGLEYAANLKHLILDRNQISDISVLEGLTNLTHLSLGHNNISNVSPLRGLTNLTHLTIGRNQISDLSPLKELVNLKLLSLTDNNISDLSPLKDLTLLIELDLEGNQLSDVTILKDLTNLTHLSLRRNKISDLSPLKDLRTLIYLSLRENKLADVSALKELTNLTYLHIAFNYTIADITPLQNLTNLIHLQLDHNIISDVSPLGNLTNIRHLDASDNEISDLSPLKNLTKLTWIDLDTNKNLDLSHLKYFPNLTFLDIHDNEITDLSHLTVLTKLRRLDLDDNLISDVSPLASLTKLTELDLSGNQIIDVSPLKNLTNLMILDLSRNHISDFSPLSELIDKLAIYKNSNQTVPPYKNTDVNRDGVMNVVDLILVALNYRNPNFKDSEKYGFYFDVNNDGVVDVKDLIAVAAAIDAAATAPTLLVYPVESTNLTVENLKQWIHLAGQLEPQESHIQSGIAVLQHLLAALIQTEEIPIETALLANYPNPFNPETWMPFQLAKPAEVDIFIYNANGKLVRLLKLGKLSTGKYHSKSRAGYWDGRNESGESVASGLYFYTLHAGDFTASGKMYIRK